MTETLKMRELTGGDIFTVLSIIGKLNIKDDVVELIEGQYQKSDGPELLDHKKKKLTKAEEAERNAAIQKRGMKLVTNIGFTLLRHVGDAKDDINSFLADLTGTTAKDINNLSMTDYTKLLFEFGKKPELKDFFQSISSLLG